VIQYEIPGVKACLHTTDLPIQIQYYLHISSALLPLQATSVTFQRRTGGGIVIADPGIEHPRLTMCTRPKSSNKWQNHLLFVRHLGHQSSVSPEMSGVQPAPNVGFSWGPAYAPSVSDAKAI